MNRTRIRLGIVAIFAALVLVTATATASTSDHYEWQAHHYSNVHRASYGLHLVYYRSCEDYWAERQARWMRDHQSLQHQDLDRIIDSCNLSYVGEVIGVGYPSGWAIVRAWMASSGHRAIILNPVYRRVGVGAVQDSDGTWWVSEVFGRHR